MPIPKINNKAPVFKGECTGNKEISLSDLKGKNVVLYFYPKDSTPGCTTEGQDLEILNLNLLKQIQLFLDYQESLLNPMRILRKRKNLILILFQILMKKYVNNMMLSLIHI